MAERIEGMSIGLELDSLQLERGLTGVRDRLKTVNSEMKRNMSAFDYADRSIGKYETRLEGLNKKLEVQKRVTDETRKEYEKMVDEHGKGSAEAEKAERAYNNQAAALNNLERYVGKATEELEEMRKEQAFQESSWGRLTTNIDKFSNKMTGLGDTLTGVGKTLTTQVTAPLMALGGIAFAASDQIDKAYREIRVGSGATGEALEGLKQSFDNVFSDVPDSADTVANALANLNTHTGATDEILEDLTLHVLDAARTLGEDGVASSEAFGKAMQQWQVPAEEGAGQLDYLYTLTQDYNVGLSQISSSLSRYGATMNNANFSMEETGHLFAMLEGQGISVSRIMPGLNSAFRSWADEGKNSREEFDKVIQTIQETEDSQEALSIATEVFGAQGAQRLTTAIRTGALPALDELGEGAEEAQGTIRETAEETRTIGERFQELKNQTMIALQPLGDILLDIAKDALPPLIDTVKNLAEWFRDLSPTTQRNIVLFGGMAAALGPLTMAFGGAFRAVGSLAGGLGRITGSIGRMMTSSGSATRSLGTLGQTTRTVSAQAGRMSGTMGGATRTMSRVGSQSGRLTGLFGKVAGSLGGIGRVAGVATNALRFLGGPMGILASVAIPAMIKGGIDLVNHLRQDAIPAVDDFGDDVSEATTEAVLGYKELNDEATVQLNQLQWSQEEITDEIAENLTGTFSEMGDQIKGSLKEDFDESYETLSAFFADSKSLSDEEQDEILKSMQTKQNEQRSAVDEHEARIKEIMEKASEERRSLTDDERDEINRIQQEMMETAVQTMSDGEVEQRAILESLRQESENITARQAAETVKNSIEAKEGTIAEANEKHDEVVKWAIRERDETGSISDEQADAIIKESERQRDESVSNAEEMHKGVVEQAKEQAEGQVDEIDWATGEVLTNWNKMIRGVARAVNTITDGINWVLDKIGIPEIPKWEPAGYSSYYGDISSYARGTSRDGHPGGLAIVGEKGRELAHIPGQGVTLVGQGGSELLNLPKGTSVLPNKHTENLLKSHGFPGYEDGVGSFWDWLTAGPRQLMNNVWDMFPDPSFDVGGTLKDMGIGIVDYLKDKTFGYIKDKIGFGSGVFGFGAPGFGSPFRLTSPFGMRTHPITGKKRMHSGVDYAAPMGTPIPAQVGGRVTFSGWAGGYGNMVQVQGPGGMSYRYAHNSRNLVGVGQTVQKGQIIALVGSTGNSTGPHVHYETLRNGRAVNPQTLNAYADGGRVVGTQWALVGEEGPELVRLPHGADVLSHDESVKALSQEPQYSSKRLTDSIMEVVKQGLEDAESRADVDVMSLVSQGISSAWDSSPARSNIQKIRDIRESNLRLLEEEIEHLKEQAKTEEDLILLNEKQAELDDLRARKAVEYQNRIRDEKALLEGIEQAHRDGLITQSQYNRASAEMTIRINELTHEAENFNRTISEEQRRALEESERIMQEYAEKEKRLLEERKAEIKAHLEEVRAMQAKEFSDMASGYMDAFHSAMDEQQEALRERHRLAIDLFDRETKAHERSINKQIEDIVRLRDERIQSIQDELDAMDEEDRLDSRAEQEEAWDEERQQLERRLVLADFMNDAKTYEAVLQEIADFEEGVEKQRREWEREDRREELRKEQERIRDKADRLIEEKEMELQNYRERREIQLEDLRQRHKAEELAFQQEYERQQLRFEALAEQLAQHVESGRMTQEQANRAWLKAVEDTGIEEIEKHHENQERTQEALEEYVDKYVEIGESYGNGLIGGLTGALKKGLDKVRSTMNDVLGTISSSRSGGSDRPSNIPGSESNTLTRLKDGSWGTWEERASEREVTQADRVAAAKRLGERLERERRERAERYHDGGWVGRVLNSDEVPAILQAGEFVLSLDMLEGIRKVGNALGNLTRMRVPTNLSPVPIPQMATDTAGTSRGEELLRKNLQVLEALMVVMEEEKNINLDVSLDADQVTNSVMERATRVLRQTSRQGG